MNNLPKIYTICLTLLCYFLFYACSNKPFSSTSIHELQTNEAQTKKTSIVAKLKENAHLPIEKRISLYHQLKKENFDLYDFGNETELTLYGYSFLWDNNLDDAISIFGLIIAEFPKVYDTKGYLADLDQLGQKLLTVHPHALKFISKEQFLKNIENKKSLITDKTTYAEFAWHCNAIIASIGCSHTASSTMQNDYNEFSILPIENSFPLQVRLINKQLFVVNPMNNADKVKVKDEILSINGIETQKLLSIIFDHTVSQANIQTAKIQRFNTFFAAQIPYALGLPKTFEVVVKERNGSIQLHKATKMATELYNPSINSCNNDLCLEIVEGNIAVLTIATFNYYEWNNYGVFKSFLDSSMKVINNKEIKNLVIDVRYNGGGSQHPSIYLLQHLMDKPFVYYSKAESEGKKDISYGVEMFHPFENRFKGEVYFLMDGNGHSTTGHFMSLVKVHNLGKIVGEELGSNQFCTAGQTMFRLRNTKFVVSSANNTHISTATNLPDNVGILPDYFITQSIDDYLNKIDAVKNYTLKLIRK